MSSVNAAGRRGPGVLRAAVGISFSCVLLGGCSAGTEQFTGLEFGNGYEAAPPPSTPTSKAAINTSQYHAPQRTASTQAQPQSGLQLASATPEQPGGYLQVSRVDLPPVQQQSSASSGVKTADGYGPYGPPPLSDGTYAGPRVYSPYDQPNGGYAPPPPPSGGSYGPPPQGGYYGGGPSSYTPPPPPRIREAVPMATSSNRKISRMADTIANRRATTIASRRATPTMGVTKEIPRPQTAGERQGPPAQPSRRRRAEKW